ncbi:MAG: porin [Myxococcaceae bacterium]
MRAWAGLVVVIAGLAAAEEARDEVDLTARLGEGVTLRSGDFSLNTRGFFQAEALALLPTADSHAVRSNQLVVRRARLILKGDLPFHLRWHLHLGFASFDLEADAPNPIRDCYVSWTAWRDLSVRVGQQKIMFDRQFSAPTGATLQMVERSLSTGEFNLDRDVGVTAYSDDLFGLGWARYAVGVYQGDGRNRLGANPGVLFAARVRVTPFGPLDDRVEGDPSRSPRFRLALGAALARNEGTARPRGTTGNVGRLPGGFNFTHATTDLLVAWRGLSLAGELSWRRADVDQRAGSIAGVPIVEYARSGWGWYAQAGAYVTDWLELTARVGEVRPFAGTDPAFGRQREVGGGLNGFLHGHDLKLQADYFWLDDGVGRDGRHQVRLLAQVAL